MAPHQPDDKAAPQTVETRLPRGPTRTTKPSRPNCFGYLCNVYADPLGEYPIHGHALRSPGSRFHFYESAIQTKATAALPAQKADVRPEMV